MKVPSELDGARVILFTINSPQNNYGTVGVMNDNKEIVDEIPITAKAICQYEGSKEYYLFSCDKEWEVIGDMDYDSIEEAKKDARLSSGVKEEEWISVDDLTEKQKQFFQALKLIKEQWVDISLSQLQLESEKDNGKVKEQQNEIIESVICSIMELLDGYNDNLGYSIDIIEQETNQSIKASIQLHDKFIDYLNDV